MALTAVAFVALIVLGWLAREVTHYRSYRACCSLRLRQGSAS